MALYFRTPFSSGSFYFMNPIDGQGMDITPPVIYGAGDLEVVIPAGQTQLSRDSTQVQSWLAQFVAVDDVAGNVSIAHDIPSIMYLIDSPITVNLSATDGVNSQAMQRQIFIYENVGIAAVMVSVTDRFKLKNAGWKLAGN